MYIYIIFWFLIFLLSFKIKKGKFKFYDYVFITLIVLFSGLRATGKDYELYSRIFEKISLNSLDSRTGIGFNYLIYFMKYKLHWNYQTLIFMFSLITNLGIYSFVKKNSNIPGLSMLIYISSGFYTTSFNMFRQSLSICMILIASQLIKEKKYYKVLFCWLIAFYIHSSSIIGILGYVVGGFFKNKKMKLKYLMPIPILGILLYDKLFIMLISKSETYGMYSTYDSAPGLGTYMNVLVYFLITIFLIIPKYKSKIKNSDECNIQTKTDFNNYNIFLIGVSIMLLELKNFLFFRIAFYFTILGPIILTNFYEEHNLKSRKIEKIVFYLCLLGYYIMYVSSFDGVLPYNFFWEV